MPYPRRATQLNGYGVIPLAPAISIGSSLVGGLFSKPRLASGVLVRIYNDERAAVDRAAQAGPAALATFINSTMLSASQAPWGTLYSPEAITYARNKLASLPTPTPQTQNVLDSVTQEIANQVAAGNIPADSAAQIAAAAGQVQTAARAGQVTGALRSLTGMNPLWLAGGAVAALLLLRKKK